MVQYHRSNVHIGESVEMKHAGVILVCVTSIAAGQMMLNMVLDKEILMATGNKQMVVFIVLGFVPMALGAIVITWKLAYAFGKQLAVMMLK